jgi:hypothetical protein
MISGSLCRHLKTAGRFVIEISSPYQPERLKVAHPFTTTQDFKDYVVKEILAGEGPGLVSVVLAASAFREIAH